METENSLQEPQQFEIRSKVIAKLRQGRPLGEVAREYRLSVAELCKWIAETVSALESVTFADGESEDDELQRLRLENAVLRKQRDFYRKAAGIVVADILPSDRRR